MKHRVFTALAAFGILLAGATASFADNIPIATLGKNITVFDNSAPAGYNGLPGSQGAEDNETEGTPATYQSQDWDVEGMFLNGSSLAMVGGYKFDTGVLHGSTWYTSGDIFLDVVGPHSVALWDYAIRMNFNTVAHTQTYDVLKLTGSTTFQLPSDVPDSTPWRVDTGYTNVAGYTGLSFSFGTTNDSGFSGWQTINPGPDGDPNWLLGTDIHYVVSGFNLGFLGGDAANFHFTMKCGNDLLLGTTVPEPTSLLLLGFGLVGLGVRTYRRR